MTRIVLAYSGGLETSVAIPWLAETYGAEVVTLTLDIGQGLELAHIRERALAAGAVRAHVLDAREEFVRGYILPALQAGAFSPEREFLGTELSRPLIARRLADIARMEGASAVAHGCSCDDSDRASLETSVRALDPGLTIIAPVCEWSMSASEVADYGRRRNIPVIAGASHRDVDANVWGRLIYGSPVAADYTLTRPVADTPADPAFMEIEFEAGVPARANGVEMPLIEMIESIETIAGTHGVGRMRGPNGAVAESPAAVVLHAAHAELSSRVPGTRDDAGASRVPGTVDHTGARHLIYGSVRVKLFKGSCEVVPRRSHVAGRSLPASSAPEAVA